jgi:hypothetical protein
VNPTDQISLNFAIIEHEYKEQTKGGTLGGTVKASFDLKKMQGRLLLVPEGIEARPVDGHRCGEIRQRRAPDGIGGGTAKRLAADGASVVVNYASSRKGPDRIVSEVGAGAGKALAVQANLAKKADVERLFDETVKAFGRVDILVNIAGVYEFLPLEEVTEKHFHRHFDLNVLGLFLAIQEAVRRFGPERRQHCEHRLRGRHVRTPDGVRLQRD